MQAFTWHYLLGFGFLLSALMFTGGLQCLLQGIVLYLVPPEARRNQQHPQHRLALFAEPPEPSFGSDWGSSPSPQPSRSVAAFSAMAAGLGLMGLFGWLCCLAVRAMPPHPILHSIGFLMVLLICAVVFYGNIPKPQR